MSKHEVPGVSFLGQAAVSGSRVWGVVTLLSEINDLLFGGGWGVGGSGGSIRRPHPELVRKLWVGISSETKKISFLGLKIRCKNWRLSYYCYGSFIIHQSGKERRTLNRTNSRLHATFIYCRVVYNSGSLLGKGLSLELRIVDMFGKKCSCSHKSNNPFLIRFAG